MKIKLYIICLVLLFASCTGRYDCTWKLKKDCRDSIKAYISAHKEYTSYLVVLKHVVSDQAGILTTGFLVGPLYGLSDQELTSLLPVEIDNAKVFIMSDLQLLMDVPEIPAIDEKYVKSMDYGYNKRESAVVNYVRHAVYMYYEDSVLMVNNRPDTLFIPKIIEDEVVTEDGKDFE